MDENISRCSILERFDDVGSFSSRESVEVVILEFPGLMFEILGVELTGGNVGEGYSLCGQRSLLFKVQVSGFCFFV